MDWNRFWELFHKSWGQCHEVVGYDKKAWNEMQQMLFTLEKKDKILKYPVQGFDGMYKPSE